MEKKLKRNTILSIFICLFINIFLILKKSDSEGNLYLIVLLIFSYIYSLIRIITSNSRDDIRKNGDASTIFHIIMLVWLLVTDVFMLVDPILYPSPSRIMELLVLGFPRFIDNLSYSFMLLSTSFSLGMLVAFPLGIILGLNKRIRNALNGYIKIISPIPTIAYIPYIVAIMPSFRSASLFVIFTAIFWPILKWTIFGVTNFDKRYTQNAKMIGLSEKEYYRHVLIPGILPSVFSGIMSSISGGFTVLVAAEMIGSRRGLGYIIKYYSDFLNYHEVIANILYLGLAITVTLYFFEKLQSFLLSWQSKEKKC